MNDLYIPTSVITRKYLLNKGYGNTAFTMTSQAGTLVFIGFPYCICSESSKIFQTAMDQTIKFEKTYEQRLEEYRDIFTGDGPFSLPRIEKEFSLYLELQVPASGWQAIWKIPKPTCHSFKIDFPTILLVAVENIDWKRLVAKVKVLAVLDDIHLPEMHVVPLVQLWPFKGEKKRNIVDVANALDVVRFFYMNLCMPWDDEYDSKSDWLDQHLESRLRIFYDLKSGVYPRNMAKHVRGLLTTAKNLQDDLEKVNCEEELIELQVALVEIGKEVELLENPLTKKVLINRAKQPVQGVVGVKNWLIFNEGTIDDYVEFLLNCGGEKKFFGGDGVVAPNLLEAWDAGSGSNFILKKGTHCIDQIGVLEEGGILSGAEKTKIISSNPTVMFDFAADVLLENLTFVCSSQSAFVVRRGKLTMRNCKIVQDKNSGGYQGVVVLNGAALEIKDSTIVGFNFAVVGNKNCTISVQNCNIIDGNYGLKVCYDCCVELENSQINNCGQYGVWVEAKTGGVQQLIAGFPVLETYVCY